MRRFTHPSSQGLLNPCKCQNPEHCHHQSCLWNQPWAPQPETGGYQCWWGPSAPNAVRRVDLGRGLLLAIQEQPEGMGVRVSMARNALRGSMVYLGNEAPLLTGMWSGGVGGITVPTCQPLPPQIPGGTPTRVSMPHSVTQLPANLHHHRQFTHTPVWLHSPVGLTKSASVSHCFRSLLHGCRTDARRGFTCRAGANTKSEPQGLCN